MAVHPSPLPRGEGALSPAAGGNGGEASGELRFDLAFETELKASLGADGQSVRFADEQGAAQFSFSKLVVVDANGKVIPARMEIQAEEPALAAKERKEQNEAESHAAASWSAPVLWRFGGGREMNHGWNLSLDAFGGKSGRGLPHSKTLARRSPLRSIHGRRVRGPRE